MRTIFLLLSSLMITSVFADNTTRRNLKRTAGDDKAVETIIAMDTIPGDSAQVRLSGYEKPLRSSKESLYVTNSNSTTLHAIEISIDYNDERGRQLHQRNIDLQCEIPSGETRQLVFPSWDKQKTMYYYLSPKSRVSNGTPYRVKTKVVRCVYSPEEKETGAME